MYPPYRFKGTIRDVRLEDLEVIEKILGEWQVDARTGAIDSSFIDFTIGAIRGSIDGKNSRRYLVAEAARGHVVGIMGLNSDEIEEKLTFGASRPIEIVSAYITDKVCRQGVGTALIEKLEEIAEKSGFTKLIIVSGSRTRAGYPFWTHRYGQPKLVQSDYYDPGEERVVWTKDL